MKLLPSTISSHPPANRPLSNHTDCLGWTDTFGKSNRNLQNYRTRLKQTGSMYGTIFLLDQASVGIRLSRHSAAQLFVRYIWSRYHALGVAPWSEKYYMFILNYYWQPRNCCRKLFKLSRCRTILFAAERGTYFFLESWSKYICNSYEAFTRY